jgi:metal-dependent amidase/aminoacylase/carboxypeptidase family protein
MSSPERNIHDEIAKSAYELFESSGGMYGCELENWLEAEKIVMERHAKEIKQEADTIGSTKGKKASGKTEPKTLKTSEKTSERSSQTKTKKNPRKNKNNEK